jgi:hypothetical protein
MENIKEFENFLSHEKNNGINEDILSSLLGSASNIFGDLGKETVAKYAISYLGVDEDSLFGRIFANAFEQVAVKEWIELFRNGKVPADLPNKMAKATIETITSMGVDGVAEKLGIRKKSSSRSQDREEMFGLFNLTGTDQGGLLYRVFSEMIQNTAANGGKMEIILTNFYSQLFGQMSKLTK